MSQPKRALLLRFEQLEDRWVLADVGDTLATALSTGLSGIGAFSHIEPIGDGSFTTRDVDLYSFTATVGARLTVLTNPAPFLGTLMNTYVRVFDALGSQLSANNDFAGAYSRLTVTLRELGTYFVGISGNPNTAYDPNSGGSGVVGSTGDYSLAIQIEAPITWTPQGPGTIRSGQVEGLTSQSNPVAGAMQAVAPHPTDPNILYAASPNGGVWKTTNATASSPNWTPLTDSLPALSIYALEFDPTDATGNTILAGTGISSSFGSSGNLIGVYKSTDGGSTWTTFSNANGLPGTTDSVRGIAARGSTIVVAMRTNGVYQSTNGGATFTKISGLGGSGLPNAGAYNLASDPGNPSRLYVVTTSGVFRSDNTGLTWADVTPAGSGLTTSTSNAKLTVHNNAGGGTNAVYVGVVNGGVLANVFRSDNQGATWIAMGIPATPDALGKVISAATNANPIVITSSAHGLTTGQQVLISSARGNTAANGVWTVTVVDANRFSLNGSTGNGTYVANSGLWTSAFAISNATNASPIVITTTAAHGLANSNVVTITGVNGNTAANGFWSVTVVNATTFSLNSSAGNGAYTSGGVWSRATTLQPNQGSIHDPEGPMRPQGFAAPPVPEGEEQPGGQGGTHFSLVADPNNPNLVYIAGDRQDSPFPNAIGAQNFTGRLFRGDLTQPAGNRWTAITHNFADADGVGVGAAGTAPHADSRDMAFDANGNLVEADDGGVYRRTSPQSSTGVWTAVIGNLAVTEAHSASYDPVSQRFISGHQDTGTAFQSAIGSSTWDQVAQGDGAVTQVAVEGANSVQYFSSQNQGSWRRRTVNAAGTVIVTNTLAGRVTIGGTNTTIFSMPDDTLQFYGPYRIHPTNPARMALGSTNYIYESLNRGDDFVRVTAPAAAGFIRSVAYGHPGNPDVIYAGGNTTATELMVRTTAGGSLVNIGGAFPGFFTAGLAIDPDDWQTLYVLDFNGRLWRTTDVGATAGNWTELTGNLTPLLGKHRSISVLDGAASDVLLVGGDNGVFAMNTDTPGVWYEVGHNLPNAPAHDVRGYSASNLISLGTLGRGVWSVSNTNTAFDTTAPGLPIITRVDPSPTTAASVSFQLTFAEPVAGLTMSNLALVTTGVSGAAITGITGGGTTWFVAVGTGTGGGTIRLDWAGAGAVADLTGNPLAVGTVTGPTYSMGLTVMTTIPAANSVVSVPPTIFTVNTSEPINVSTLNATDFSVNGVAATSLDYVAGTTTLTFIFAVTPVNAQGLQTMHVDSGAFVSAIDGGSVAQFDATFRYDVTLLQVTSTLPPFPGGSFTLPGPFTLDMNFNEPIATSSVQTTDLVLSGLAGAVVSGVSFPSGDTMARFTISGIGPATQGTLNASIAAGTINDSFGNPNGAFAASYQVVADTVAPRVITATLADGATITPGTLTYTATFSEPMRTTTLDTADFSLRGIFRKVTYAASTSPAPAWNAAGTQVTVTYTGLPDDAYTLTLLSSATAFGDAANNNLDGEFAGVFPSGNGAAGGDFQTDFIMDLGATTEALPTPMEHEAPLGSLAYDPSLTRVIAFATDSDDLTLAIDSGQTATVLVTAVDPAFQPTVQLRSGATVLGTASATAAGRHALIQTIPINTTATYTVRVSGLNSTTGAYNVQIYLNAAIEASNVGIGAPHNKTRETAQNLDTAFSTVSTPFSSATRTAVLGGVLAGSVTLAATDSGWWDSTGLHTASNKNYIAGRFNSATQTARDYFVFDLTSISQTISAAQLQVQNPAGGYSSPDATETYALFDVTTAVGALGNDGTGQTAIYTDLGGGTSFGSRVFSAADNNFLTSTTINANGVSALNTARGTPFALGGALTTISANLVDNFVFGSSGSTALVKQLQLTLPATDTDFYSFSLTAGQTATLALENLSGSGTSIALQDAAGNPVGPAAVSAANLDQVIKNFVAPTTGVYFVMITSTGNANYNLVITRNAAFDTEVNDTFDTAQPLAGNVGALGGLDSGVVPSSLQTVDGNSNNNFPFNIGTANTMRYQQLYSSAEFSQQGTITALRFRRNGGVAPFANATIDIRINMAYAATSYASPSTTFADNVGPGVTQVLNNDAFVLSTGSATATPNAFDVVIPITPFTYDPKLGDLLVDIFMERGGTTSLFDASTASGLDQQSRTRRVVSASSPTGVTSLTGSIDSSFFGLVTQFDMAPREDWYAVEVSATSPNIRLQTSTPAGGTSQFVNLLNPRLDLFHLPVGGGSPVPVGSRVLLADGRNESIQLHAFGLLPGSYRVRVTAEGGTAGEYFLSAVALQNSPPLVAGDTALTLEDAPVTINVLANDTDPDGAIDPTTVVIEVSPLHGTVTINPATGQVTYSPAPNYNGADSFRYSVKDDSGVVSNVAIVNITITPVNDVSGFDVQHNAQQRSYIRYLDLIFENSQDLTQIMSSTRTKLTRYGLDGVSNPIAMNLTGIISSAGNQLSLDFGAQGIGGNRNTIAGDGYYRLAVDTDGDGLFETTRSFYRLFGDVNGDRQVTQADADVIYAAYGQSGANLDADMNGDGYVNSIDRGYSLRSIGKKLVNGLWLDD